MHIRWALVQRGAQEVHRLVVGDSEARLLGEIADGLCHRVVHGRGVVCRSRAGILVAALCGAGARPRLPCDPSGSGQGKVVELVDGGIVGVAEADAGVQGEAQVATQQCCVVGVVDAHVWQWRGEHPAALRGVVFGLVAVAHVRHPMDPLGCLRLQDVGHL